MCFPVFFSEYDSNRIDKTRTMEFKNKKFFSSELAYMSNVFYGPHPFSDEVFPLCLQSSCTFSCPAKLSGIPGK